MSKIQSRSRPAPAKRGQVSEARFLPRVVRMGVVKQPATTTAAMEGLLRQGICTRVTRQWLDQKLEVGPGRDELLAQVYE